MLLGERQLADAGRWEEAGLLALVGIGVELGLSDVFARYAADELFAKVDEVSVRDGADLVVEGYDFAPASAIAPASLREVMTANCAVRRDHEP